MALKNHIQSLNTWNKTYLIGCSQEGHACPMNILYTLIHVKFNFVLSKPNATNVLYFNQCWKILDQKVTFLYLILSVDKIEGMIFVFETSAHKQSHIHNCSLVYNDLN